MFPGAGTLINVILAILGGFLGLCIKKGLKASLQEALLNTLGIASMFIGISGAMTGLLTLENGKLSTSGTMLMILSMVIGTFIGELLRIEDRMNSLAKAVQRNIHIQDNKHQFMEGVVNMTLIMCVGAMSIMGALQDGLNSDPSLLIAKGCLDFITAMIFASTLGAGVLFAVVPMALYQGSITLLSKVVEPILTEQMTQNMTFIGSVLIFVVGFNMLFSERKIRVANMLPSLLVPIVWELLQWLWSILPFAA